MSSADNAKKSQHGANAQNGISEMLIAFKNNGYIKDISKDYHIGREGYDANQFYAPFMITFDDGEKWAIFSTTSYRSDRLKGQLWDSYNLKKIDSKIKFSFLVYPDALSKKEKNGFLSASKQVLEERIFSSIDSIVSQSEFNILVENKHYKNKSAGVTNDAKGRIFESRIAQILSNPENLEKFKTNDNIKTGIHFDSFLNIINTFEINPKTVKSINASSNIEHIGRLTSGGQPKTDVLVDIIFNDGSSKCYTISCKRTNNSYVSVHQYTADKFADILDPNNTKLRLLLKDFQSAGGVQALGVQKTEELTIQLKPYLKKLGLWVLGGFNDINSTEKQCAQYFLTYTDKNNDITMHTVEEYYDLLISKGIRGQFGTVFSWTFASKQKGKSIQLKSKII